MGIHLKSIVTLVLWLSIRPFAFKVSQGNFWRLLVWLMGASQCYNRQKPRVPLNIIICTGKSPQQRILQPQMLIPQRLRNLGLKDNCRGILLRERHVLPDVSTEKVLSFSKSRGRWRRGLLKALCNRYGFQRVKTRLCWVIVETEDRVGIENSA